MKILVFDNYDSFTYNLVHMLRELGFGADLEVHRNDKILLEEVDRFDKILLSPGPGIPSEAGVMLSLIKHYGPTKSILGICLGHQGIAETYGATLFNMEEVLHGISSEITIEDSQDILFKEVPLQMEVGRYHSWAVIPESINDQLQVTARDAQGEIMALRHHEFDVAGLQFHPESVLTPSGKQIIKNWIEN